MPIQLHDKILHVKIDVLLLIVWSRDGAVNYEARRTGMSIHQRRIMIAREDFDLFEHRLGGFAQLPLPKAALSLGPYLYGSVPTCMEVMVEGSADHSDACSVHSVVPRNSGQRTCAFEYSRRCVLSEWCYGETQHANRFQNCSGDVGTKCHILGTAESAKIKSPQVY